MIVISEHSKAAPPAEASLALAEDSACIAQARHLTSAFLQTARDQQRIPVSTADVEIAQLVVSELVTNVRKHAPGPATLQLQITDAGLQIRLWDSNPVLPTVQALDPQRIGQHGLEIVAALTQSVTIKPTPDGKRITAITTLGG
ncbi:ATP-binding protein [Streptomyces sp. NPDC055056]